MGEGSAAVLYAVALTAGWACGRQLPAARGAPRVPWATGTALVLVGVPSSVQLVAVPQLLEELSRRPDELTSGEPWRLVTSLVVQDGGWAGAIVNLVGLAVVGSVAERVWGSARWWVVWLFVGVTAQFWGLVVQPHGGGNSVATFGLAASLAVRALSSGTQRARAAGVVCLVAGLVLLALRDVHGGAVVLGAAAGIALTRGRGVRTTAPGRPPPAPPR